MYKRQYYIRPNGKNPEIIQSFSSEIQIFVHIVNSLTMKMCIRDRALDVNKVADGRRLVWLASAVDAAARAAHYFDKVIILSLIHIYGGNA